MFHISYIYTHNLLCILPFYYKIRVIFGITLPTVGRFSLYKGKSTESWLVHEPELFVEVYLNNYRSYLFHASIYFQKCTSLSIIRKFFKQIHQYITLIQGISITFTDQMPTYLVFKKVHSMLVEKFSTV